MASCATFVLATVRPIVKRTCRKRCNSIGNFRFFLSVNNQLSETYDAATTKLIARSASAVMVRLGFTPRLAATTEPSQTYMF